uniref:L1 transposable element RRM domain-containing protein n=1 Tax=Takifugu rubripes TaxID=31033 RepID=A0A674P707_TAKRU
KQRSGRKGTDSTPRTFIMKFLNYKDKEAVMKAARAKKQVHYKSHPVRLYHDVTAEMHKKQKEFEEARRQLRTLGLRYGQNYILELQGATKNKKD